MSLRDKVILVTGGTSGIGEACTEWFAQGAKVIAASIQDEAGEALAAR
jgi:NAD(P)-dependent dehydrogenase (short-subunit alcohol dehydrogenase family)